MTPVKSKRPRRQPDDDVLRLPRPEDLFAPRGGEDCSERAQPLTPEEAFRERVALAWGWIKTIRFREAEHDRLRAVLVEMIAAGNL